MNRLLKFILEAYTLISQIKANLVNFLIYLRSSKIIICKINLFNLYSE
jgi:hypothetical protein